MDELACIIMGCFYRVLDMVTLSSYDHDKLYAGIRKQETLRSSENVFIRILVIILSYSLINNIY